MHMEKWDWKPSQYFAVVVKGKWQAWEEVKGNRKTNSTINLERSEILWSLYRINDK
jgi:acyl-CoA-binding protein